MNRKIIYLLACCLATNIYAQSPYSAIPLPNGSILDKRIKTDLKVDNQNNTWIAFGSRTLAGSLRTSNIGLAQYNGTSWTTWNKDNSILPNNSLTCLEIKGSSVWIGTSKGLVKKDGSNWSIYNKGNSGIISDSVNDVSVLNNTIWVATNNGVSTFDGTSWTSYTTATHAIADNKVNTILADKNGSVWIGTDKGVSQLSNGVWSTFSKSNSGLRTDKINTIEQTANGTIWIGTDSAMIGPDLFGGLYIVKNNSIVTAQEYSGYCGTNGFQNNIYSIGIHGNNTIVPSCIANGNFSSKVQFLEVASNATSVYKNRSQASFPTHSNGGLFCAVTSNNQLQWCGRDGFAGGDSLYIIDISKYAVAEQGPTKSLLNINKVSTPILNRGDMFWDLQSGGYEVPKGSCKLSLSTSALWMGGITNNSLRLAAQTYRQSGNDYFPGPLKIGTATTDAATQQKFDRIWRINRQTVEEFKVNFAQGNVTNGTYPVPENLTSWPAHGDSVNGYASNLAPFVDVNGDGIYNPMNGDYPKIKGDQMLFWIFNDNGGIHTETQGSPLRFEVHASAYGYTCDDIQDNDSNTALNYTTFYQYDIYNRSSDTYDSVKYGIWTDVDLGNFNDDYIGCNPAKDYAIGYNGDDDDEGIQGYGLNPPAIAIAILDNNSGINKMSGFMYYNNDFSSVGNPNQPDHYWGYLNSRWKDGSPLTYGGYGKGGTEPTNFIYPGNNDLAGRPEWTEHTAANVPGDRRMLSTLSSSGQMQAGSKHTIEYALVYSRATSGGAAGSINKLDADIEKVRNWYANQSFPSCLDLTTGLNTTAPLQNKTLTVYPNPANQSISLQVDGLTPNATYQIIDITGRKILSGTVQESINIQPLQSGVYFVQVKDGTKTVVTKFIKN